MQNMKIASMVSLVLLQAGPSYAVTITDATVFLKIGEDAAKTWGAFEDRFLKGNRAAAAQAKVRSPISEETSTAARFLAARGSWKRSRTSRTRKQRQQRWHRMFFEVRSRI